MPVICPVCNNWISNYNSCPNCGKDVREVHHLNTDIVEEILYHWEKDELVDYIMEQVSLMKLYKIQEDLP